MDARSQGTLILRQRKLVFQYVAKVEFAFRSREAVAPNVHTSSNGSVGLLGTLVFETRVGAGKGCFRKVFQVVGGWRRYPPFQRNEGLCLQGARVSATMPKYSA